MEDMFGRTVDYLRLSVTDRCNYRCRYCMPESDICKRSYNDPLSAAECIEIGEAAVACGVKKIRLTGGEPLVRKEILEICRGLSEIPGLEELCLTTNGALLPSLAKPLRQAGVSRLNISLDTLISEKLSYITRRGFLSDIMDGIFAAENAGFSHLKINTVLIGGFNDDEIGDLINLTIAHPWEIRFIELMPMGPCAHWDPSCFMPNKVILEKYPFLESLPAQGVAQRYQLPGALGTVGLISPLSHEFCGECRRIRVTADGKLKGCLHAREEISLRGLHGAQLETAIRWGILQKPQHHHLAERPSDTPRTMNQIGG